MVILNRKIKNLKMMKLLSLLYYFLNSGFCKCRLKELALIQEIENDIYKTLILGDDRYVKF